MRFLSLLCRLWHIPLTLLLVLFIVLGISFSTYPFAHATLATDVDVSITPTSGSYSAKSITITGAGYAAHEAIDVYWNYSGPGTGTLETSTAVNTTGAFTASFPLPLAATGTYTIAGVGVTSGRVATSTFHLLPALSALGKPGVPGFPLTLDGFAFGAGESVSIYWNYVKGGGTFLTTTTADNTGSFTTTFTVPSSPSSGFSVLAGIGQSSKTTATFSLTIFAQTLTVAPLSGAAASLVTLSAYGFGASENIKIYWNNDSTPMLISATDDVGYMAPLSFTVPAGAEAGAYTLRAVGQTSHVTITNSYTVVAPSIVLSLSAAPVGAQILAAGQGYTASELVDIRWNSTGPGTGTLLTTVTAGFSGSIRATFTVPLAATGVYPVAFIGQTSNSDSQSTMTVSNGLAASPTTTPPGTRVTVTGMGYGANEAVHIYWKGRSGLLLATTIANASGTINQAITIPTNAPNGSNRLVAVGQINHQSFSTLVIIRVDWSDFGFDASNLRSNPFEQQVSSANVGKLRVKWVITSPKPLESSPVAANGLVYIPSLEGQLSAYMATTGKLAWRYDSTTGFPNYSSALVDPDTNTVFFGTVSQPSVGLPSPFFALDATTGVLKWSLILPWDEFGFPTLGLNTIYVGTTDEGGSASLMAIDDVSGKVDWQDVTEAAVWGAVGIDPENQLVFTGIGNPTDAIAAFDATTGAFIWQYNLPQYGPDNDAGSAIAVENGRVYTNSKNGYFYALNERDGSLAWSTLIGTRSGGNISSSALANGVIYVGSRDANLYALDESNGNILWKTPTGAAIFSSPTIANGVAYVASIDKKFYAIDASSGTVLWSFTTRGKSYSSPILINGYLYCASTDHRLYAFTQ